MKSTRWIAVVLLALFMIVVVLFAVFICWFLFNLVEVPSLIQTATLEPTTTVLSIPSTSAATSTSILRSTPTAAPSPTPTTALVCGESGSWIFLVLGEGTLDDSLLNGADAIRLVRVDFDPPRVVVVALPPGLWALTPRLDSQGISATTLTLAYYYARQTSPGKEREKMISATALIAQTLVDNFAFSPQHYITVRQPVFEDMVEAISGIQVDLPSVVDGRPDHMGYFPAGVQFIDGEQARNFVRILHPAGDSTPTEAERIYRQNLVIQAIIQSVLKPENWDRLPALVTRFQQDVVTDLSPTQLLSLACLLRQPDLRIEQDEVDSALTEPGHGLIQYPHTEEVRRFLAEKLGP